MIGTCAGTSYDGTSQPGLSIQEAAVVLGVSPNTVRRWCATGRLRSERVARPQGDAIRVYLDGDVPGTSRGTSQEVPDEIGHDVPPRYVPQVPTELQRAEALAEYSAQLLAPVVAELATSRRQLVAQAEELGRLRSKLEAAQARILELELSKEAMAETSNHPTSGQNGQDSAAQTVSEIPEEHSQRQGEGLR